MKMMYISGYDRGGNWLFSVPPKVKLRIPKEIFLSVDILKVEFRIVNIEEDEDSLWD